MTTATAGSAGGRLPLLRGRDFRLLLIGETTSSLGSSVTSVALPLVALTVLHAGVITVAVLSAAAWLPWLVIGLPAGAWVDRLPRRTVMMLCDIVSALLFASIPVAYWCGELTVGQLVAVALLTGTGKVFFTTAYRAYLPALVSGADLVGANAQLQGADSAAQIAGPGVGGLLAQTFGAVTGLLADAISFAVSLCCLIGIRARETRTARTRRPLRAEIAEGAAFVLEDPLLRILTIFGGAANFILTAYTAIVVAFLVRHVGLSSGTSGVLIAIGGTGGVLGAVTAPVFARRFGGARALLVLKMSGPLFGLLIPLTAADWRLAWFVVGAVGMEFCIVGNNVIYSGFLPSYCPAGLMGRVTTSVQVVNYGAMPLGALAGGALVAGLGYVPALWTLFGAFVVSSLVLLRGPLRGRRDLPEHPERYVSQSPRRDSNMA